jgi:hypothetical protein
VQSDSILLSKIKEKAKSTFGYYFDCHNNIVLAMFVDVHAAMMSYIGDAQNRVLGGLLMLWRQKIREGLETTKVKLQSSPDALEKKQQENKVLFEAEMLISPPQQKNEL